MTKETKDFVERHTQKAELAKNIRDEIDRKIDLLKVISFRYEEYDFETLVKEYFDELEKAVAKAKKDYVK